MLKLLPFILSFVLVISLNTAFANEYGVGRIRTCTASSGSVTIEGLDFNPTTGGKDIDFVMSNPVCITVAATSYAAVKTAITAMNSTCGTGSSIRIKPSPLLDLVDIAKGTKNAIQNKNGACGVAVAAATASLGVALGQLGVIYGIANHVYDTTKICGGNWMKPSATRYNYGTPNYKQTVKLVIEGWLRDKKNNKLTLTNDDTEDAKTYREWYYGGVEVADDPDEGEICYDVTQPKVDNEYPRQKYYLKGTETGNFNCKKYLIEAGQNDPKNNQPITSQRLEEMNQAYRCCIKRSMEYICINYDGKRKFCRGGTRCTIDGITFSTKVLDEGRLVCAETYSLCPYNFSISGGTENCDYYRDGKWDEDEGRWKMITPEQVEDGACAPNSEIRNPNCTYNNKAGKCKNYCQYMTHCTKTSDHYRFVNGIVSPYFSQACMNFVGDSQNKVAFNGGFILGSQKHFSAPIAQCLKETLENVFYDRAGHSRCLNYNEIPSANGVCPSGSYAITIDGYQHKLGNRVKHKSFFVTIQDNLRSIVKIVLTLSITFYGVNILLFKTSLGSKKDILIYILKIGLVMYFATGDAWQGTFFKGVYNTSSDFAMIVFKIETQASELKRDGCQFGNVSLPDGTQVSSGATYPPGKEYLAIWDTLDCKIMRYLGFGPEMSAANIAMLVLASYFTGPIGIYFALSVLIFGMLLIAATIRALHIFLASALAIVIMVFVSPIIIPLALFEKTKNLFDNWLKELISFCLQPMILFAYIAIFINVMDKTLMGSAEFSGYAPFKTINCAEKCLNPDGSVDPYVDGQMPECDKPNQVIINPLDDSVACLINVNDFGSFPGLEIIGLAIPIMKNLFESNVKERVLTILKGALVMYLIYKFMDQIPGITSSLIGGKGLPTSKADGVAMFKKTLGVSREIQKRLARGAGKLGKKGATRARDKIGELGDKGKSVSDAKGSSGGDSVGSSGSSGGDSAGSSGSSGGDSTGGSGSSGGDSTR